MPPCGLFDNARADCQCGELIDRIAAGAAGHSVPPPRVRCGAQNPQLYITATVHASSPATRSTCIAAVVVMWEFLVRSEKQVQKLHQSQATDPDRQRLARRNQSP